MSSVNSGNSSYSGIRYDARLEQDMDAIPIGARRQRFAAAASRDYLARRGRPQHPRELLGHACLRGKFASGAMFAWEVERDGETVKLDPAGPLVVRIGAATDLAVDAARAGAGIVYLFEDWLRPHLDGGALEPVLGAWWPSFTGPFLYYPRPAPPAGAAARFRRLRAGDGPRSLAHRGRHVCL